MNLSEKGPLAERRLMLAVALSILVGLAMPVIWWIRKQEDRHAVSV